MPTGEPRFEPGLSGSRLAVFNDYSFLPPGFCPRTLSLGFSSSSLINSFFTTESVLISVRVQAGRGQCTKTGRF